MNKIPNLSASNWIALVALIVTLFLGVWNISLQNKLSRLQFDEFAPKILAMRAVTVDSQTDSVQYLWLIKNTGRRALEKAFVEITTTNDLPIDTCVLEDRNVSMI